MRDYIPNAKASAKTKHGQRPALGLGAPLLARHSQRRPSSTLVIRVWQQGPARSESVSAPEPRSQRQPPAAASLRFSLPGIGGRALFPQFPQNGCTDRPPAPPSASSSVYRHGQRDRVREPMHPAPAVPPVRCSSRALTRRGAHGPSLLPQPGPIITFQQVCTLHSIYHSASDPSSSLQRRKFWKLVRPVSQEFQRTY